MTLTELINALVDQAVELNPHMMADLDWLADADVDPNVLLAMQPSWPFEHRIGDVVLHDPLVEWDDDYGPKPDDDDSAAQDHWVLQRELAEAEAKTIFIGEGGQQAYLRDGVSALLGWKIS